ncbi:hypothetical protein BT67DRAFT_84791 [Trichocladium antarcticum]|uniref:Transmembrane protein n=1 Tax=Trichocladium antarcticum TaxID=1450529 RepID=A0AAN6UG04_9PEZI|nr:hypothetical protein BT67DRAFT_84791 [Trichocladium antarcticum]
MKVTQQTTAPHRKEQTVVCQVHSYLHRTIVNKRVANFSFFLPFVLFFSLLFFTFFSSFLFFSLRFLSCPNIGKLPFTKKQPSGRLSDMGPSRSRPLGIGGGVRGGLGKALHLPLAWSRLLHGPACLLVTSSPSNIPNDHRTKPPTAYVRHMHCERLTMCDLGNDSGCCRSEIRPSLRGLVC